MLDLDILTAFVETVITAHPVSSPFFLSLPLPIFFYRPGKFVPIVSDFYPTGWDQFCRDQEQYGFHDLSNGTFSYGAVWDAKCVYRIPDGYDSTNAAPLMCAGATVWTVLTEFGIRPMDRVAIMGVGGLGHLAIKLAAALGYKVVVLSSSESKRQEAFEYGATEYHVWRTGDKVPEGFMPLKHLLLCGNSGVDFTS